jgi:hypothetical protein
LIKNSRANPVDITDVSGSEIIGSSDPPHFVTTSPEKKSGRLLQTALLAASLILN